MCTDPVARLAHLMDQLAGAALAVTHARVSVDPIVRTTAITHVRNYHDLQVEIETLVRTSPEARRAFFNEPTEAP